MNLRNPKHIIIAGIVFFAIAFVDYIVYSPNVIYDWFDYLHWWGKLAIVGFVACLIGVFVVTLYKRK